MSHPEAVEMCFMQVNLGQCVQHANTKEGAPLLDLERKTSLGRNLSLRGTLSAVNFNAVHYHRTKLISRMHINAYMHIACAHNNVTWVILYENFRARTKQKFEELVPVSTRKGR